LPPSWVFGLFFLLFGCGAIISMPSPQAEPHPAGRSPKPSLLLSNVEASLPGKLEVRVASTRVTSCGEALSVWRARGVEEEPFENAMIFLNLCPAWSLPMNEHPEGEPYKVRFREEIPPSHKGVVALDSSCRET
jgi:hypothetical protein